MTLLLATAMLLACAMLFSGPLSQAHATNTVFCDGYLAAPYGQPGDQCNAGFAANLTGVTGEGFQHSGCVDALSGGSLVTSWACAPTGSVAATGFDGTRSLVGTVRNNTTGDTNHLQGFMFY